jgi:hypothetical protein
VGVGVGSATLPLLGFSMTIVEDDLSCLAGRPAESDDPDACRTWRGAPPMASQTPCPIWTDRGDGICSKVVEAVTNEVERHRPPRDL